MTDIHTPEIRSRNMSAISGKDTKPELKVRRMLHAKGFRFRLRNRHLPGNPDIVLPKYKAVIFVNGCFWHLHSCPLFHWPAARSDWWREKLTANKARDEKNLYLLQALGWRVAVIWECSLKGRRRLSDDDIVTQLSGWLKSQVSDLTLSGYFD
ncbi:MAG: DNA mismatch endonuclease Vsr [Hahellaceae bacterium]|nr:DNA mismatch endonuclease Vsr [Hahellaceae bacterium]